jgi:transcriptional regulator with XRE-family HTH domain
MRQKSILLPKSETKPATMSQPTMPQPNRIPSLKPHKRVYGTIIRQKREQQGLSQEDMAQLLNMSHNGYWKIENDQTKLTAETMENIATILKTDATEFLQGDYSKYRNKQINGDQVSNPIMYQYNFDGERKVWQELDKARQETIEAKNQAINAQNALIIAQSITIDTLKTLVKE